MLNGNKRSITIDSKNPKGKEILERLIKHCDVLVENFAPGALDRMGLTWEYIHKTNPRMIVASVKGFGPGPYEDCKVYENVAQCAGGAASTTGFREGPPLVTGAQIGDSGTGLHLAFGICCALIQRQRTGRGQKVLCAMQDGVLNLARVKLRDQQRLAHGPLTEYSQYGEGIPFGKAVPRAGNDSGGGQPGWILKCKGWETDPDAYIYFITQAPVWGPICDLIGKPEWKTDPDYATPPARLPRLKHIFDTIEEWTMTKTKFEVMDICNQHDIPVGPILSMKEIAEEQSLRDTGTVVEVDHPGARQVSHRRQSGEDVGLDHRGEALAALGRAHRGDSDQGARLFRQGVRRDQDLRRDHAAGETREGRGGVSTHSADAVVSAQWRPLIRGLSNRACEVPVTSATATWVPACAGTTADRLEETECVSWSTASRRSARPCWRRCIKRGENVVAAYVAPEKPGQKADPLKEAALAAKLPVYQPASYRKPEVWEEFRALKPDLQVMAFVTLFVPEDFLNIPTHGSIQYHPSLLPAGRGPSAINWPIIKGETETGLSIFWPDNGLDTGDVLIQKKTPISATDTLGTRLLRSPVPDGRRGHARGRRPGEGRQGAAHQAGRIEGHVRRPLRSRQRPHRLGQDLAAHRPR